MNKLRSWKFAAALTLIAAAGLLTSTAKAQTAAPTPTSAPTDDQTQVLEKFVVTGSNIGGAAEALSIPVAVVSPSDIQNSGIETNVMDLLRKISPSISGLGGENATTSENTTNGGSQLSLHNLPTLVLVNGRRIAYDPVDASGGVEFVDLNTIPMAAIDHIDVLSGGSSAIYGSDAVGGVVNVILKQDYNGWEVNTHYGISDTTGHYSERTASLTGGVSNGTTSVTASFEYTQSDPIYESQRPYINPFYATTYVPGIIEVFGLTTNSADPSYGEDEFYQLKAGLNAPPGGGTYTIQQLVSQGIYTDLGSTSNDAVVSQVEHILNLAAKETLQQATKREAATANFNHKIFGDKLEGFGYFIFSHVNTESGLNAQPLFPYISTPNSDLGFYGVTPPAPGTENVPVGAPTNPFSQAFLDQGHSDGAGGYAILVHNRFIPFPRRFLNDDYTYTEVGGFRGQINADWSWEVAADLSRYSDAYTNPGVLSTNGLIAAFVSGQVNPFAITQDAGSLDSVVGTAFVNYVSTNNTFDALLRGALFELPAGKVNFAVGADVSRQNLTAIPDQNTANNLWIDSPTVLPFNANRTITSGYAELEVPLVDKSHPLPGVYAADLDAAERYDTYTGKVGSSKVPKISLKYQPFDDQLTLRASAGRSFIAPQLYSLYGPTTTGSSELISYTTINGAAISNVQFQGVTGSNPNLAPTKASTWNVGLTFTPKAIPNLSVTFDYFDTTEHGVPGAVDQGTVVQSVEDLGASSPYAGDVHFGSPTGPGPTATGQISNKPFSDVYLVTPTLNLGAVSVKGFDASITYQQATNYGKFEFASTVTVYNSYALQVLPSEDYYQYAGTISSTNETGSEGGTIPKWRTYTSIQWKYKGLGLLAANSFVPQVNDVGSGGVNQSPPLKVASYDQWDFAVSYSLSAMHWNRWTDNLKVTVGVNNAFNYEPPIGPYGTENTKADTGTYDGAVGRMFFSDVSYKF
jgi:iron complex outermembrane receptor protein